MEENSHALFDVSMPSLQTNMNNGDFDVKNTTRKHDQHHDFLDEAKLEEEQSQEEHLPSEENHIQDDAHQIEVLQLPLSSSYDLLKI